MTLKEIQKTINPETEYIGADGLVYCKKCNGCKVYENKQFGKVMKVPCKCQQADKLREREQNEQSRKQYEIYKLRLRSLLSDGYEFVTFDSTDLNGADDTFIEAYKRSRKYCQILPQVKEKGQGLYFWGNTGVGKTHLMACIANYLIEHGEQVLFTSMIHIASELSKRTSRYNDRTQEFIDKLTSVDFLFIDDLATENYVDSYGKETELSKHLYSILEQRNRKNKPTIFTSNYSLKQLGLDKGFTPKLIDRIIDKSAIIEVKGISYRLKRKKKEGNLI